MHSIITDHIIWLWNVSKTQEQSVQMETAVQVEDSMSVKNEHPIIDNLTMYIASDIHYISPALHDNGKAFEVFSTPRNGQEVKYIDKVFEAFVSQIKKYKPDVLTLSGDLTVNGEKQSHEDMAKLLKSIPNTTKIYVIPGNHDINNVNARKMFGEHQEKTPFISEDDFANIYADFGFNSAIFRDENSLSYMVAPSDKLWILMLDTCKYKENVVKNISELSGVVNENTMKWLDECAKMAEVKGAELMVVQHHNLVDHNEMISEGFTVDNSEDLVKKYQDTGVQLVFSGHIHCQSITRTGETYDVASGAMCMYPQHFGKLIYDGKTFIYSTKTVAVEEYAKQNGLTDDNLLSYKTYSKNYFLSAGGDRSNQSDKRSPEEQALISETMKELNMLYFSGESKKDIVNSEGYQLLIKDGGFLTKYAQSIIKDDGVQDNYLEINIKQ